MLPPSIAGEAGPGRFKGAERRDERVGRGGDRDEETAAVLALGAGQERMGASSTCAEGVEWRMRGTEPPRVKRNPGVQAGSGVRLWGGEMSQGEERCWRAGRGREEYKERGAGMKAKAGGDSVGEGEREGHPFWGW